MAAFSQVWETLALAIDLQYCLENCLTNLALLNHEAKVTKHSFRFPHCIFYDSNALRTSLSEVICYSTQVRTFVEPIQSIADLHDQGFRAGMAAGSVAHAMLNSYVRSEVYLWSGERLTKTIAAIEKNLRMFKQHQHLMLVAHLLPYCRTVSALNGISVETLTNSPSNLDVDDTPHVESELRMSNPAQSKAFYFNKMSVEFLFRKYDTTKLYAIKYSDFKVKKWMAFFHQSIYTFYAGLVSFWIGREDDSGDWIGEGKESKLELQKLARSCSWNFQNKLLLLSAEEHFCERNFDLAEKFYDDAIASAHEHRLVNEEALANELAGSFYHETGRRQKSIPYFSQAIEKYNAWEAHAKAKALKKYVDEVITSIP